MQVLGGLSSAVDRRRAGQDERAGRQVRKERSCPELDVLTQPFDGDFILAQFGRPVADDARQAPEELFDGGTISGSS